MRGEVRREWVSLLNHWIIGAVILAVATGIGSALVAPPSSADTWQRVAFAALGVLVGIAAVMLGVLILALLRVPAAEYRERHRLRRLGQELMDVGYEMIFIAAPYRRADDGSVALARQKDWISLVSKYNTTLATRVFHSTRELEKNEIISRERRDHLNKRPTDLASYFARVIDLVDLGNLLGAKHPNREVTKDMLRGAARPKQGQAKTEAALESTG